MATGQRHSAVWGRKDVTALLAQGYCPQQHRLEAPRNSSTGARASSLPAVPTLLYIYSRHV
jgi:hypothetical protein